MIMSGHGIPVPVSFDDKTSREFIVRELGFPLLSKPRIGRGGGGVTLYYNLEELFQETRTGLIFQEFIPGEDRCPSIGESVWSNTIKPLTMFAII